MSPEAIARAQTVRFEVTAFFLELFGVFFARAPATAAGDMVGLIETPSLAPEVIVSPGVTAETSSAFGGAAG